VHEVLAGGRFGKITIGAGGENLVHNLLRVMHRKGQDFCPGPVANDLAQYIETVHDGHVDIQNHEVGRLCEYFLNRVFSVHGFPADLEAR